MSNVPCFVGIDVAKAQLDIAAACRRLAAQPLQALALIGIALEN